jgi:hypothetical protein
MFVVLAIVFNPIVKFPLGLGLWILVDIATVVMLIISFKKLKLNTQK